MKTLLQIILGASLLIIVCYIYYVQDDELAGFHELDRKIDALTVQHNKAMDALLMMILSRVVAHLDVHDKNFATVESTGGFFLITCKSFEPIPNGYRLHLSVGNPNNEIVKNPILHFMYGPIREFSSTTPIDGTISPGTWFDVDAVISPIKDEDLKTLAVSINASDIFLFDAPPSKPAQ